MREESKGNIRAGLLNPYVFNFLFCFRVDRNVTWYIEPAGCREFK